MRRERLSSCTFTLNKRSPLHTIFLLSGGQPIPPIVRVVIVVTVNGTPEVLMDGVMTQSRGHAWRRRGGTRR